MMHSFLTLRACRLSLVLAFVWGGWAHGAIDVGQLKGRVFHGDDPVAGSKVRLCEKLDLMPLSCAGRTYDATTGADGTYQFDKVKPGKYAVAAKVVNTNQYTVQLKAGHFTVEEIEVVAGKTAEASVLHLIKSDIKILFPRVGDAVKSARPVLRWQAYPNASSYRVSVAPYRGLWDKSINLYTGESLTTSETQFEPRSSLPNGKYEWTLSAFTSGGIKLAEKTLGLWFSVKGQQNSPKAVKLLAPTGGSGSVVASKLRFSWEPYPGANTYEWELWGVTVKGGLVRTSARVESAHHDWGETPAPGDYRWSVKAYDGYRMISKSPSVSFRVK